MKPDKNKKDDDFIMSEQEQKLRDGIFNLETIRFGKIPEIMIKKIYNYEYASGTTDYDLYKLEGTKKIPIEVKFSCAREKEDIAITEDNALSVCINNATQSIARKISYENLTKKNFDSNIQQIKPYLFKTLYYGLFLEDRIAVFKVPSDDLKAAFKWVPFHPITDKTTKILSDLNDFEASSSTSLPKKIFVELTKIQNILTKIQLKSGDVYLAPKAFIADNNLIQLCEDFFVALEDATLKSDIITITKTFCNTLEEIFAPMPQKNDIQRIPKLSIGQHKKNDSGEGQFHITQDTINWHLNTSRYFEGWLSYRDLYKILSMPEDATDNT